MPINELWPVIIPGVLLQILIQVYYIRHCWKNTRLSMRHKWIYTFVISVFSLPAAAVYLINNRDKASIHDNYFIDVDIDTNVRQGNSFCLLWRLRFLRCASLLIMHKIRIIY